MNVLKANLIIDASTEVSDGLFLFINQGQKVIDCVHYTTSTAEVYTAQVYEPTDLVNFEPVMNVGYVKQDFDFDKYEKKLIHYFATRAEMHAFLLEQMSFNWF